MNLLLAPVHGEQDSESFIRDRPPRSILRVERQTAQTREHVREINGTLSSLAGGLSLTIVDDEVHYASADLSQALQLDQTTYPSARTKHTSTR
jgi:hypothetical protein